MSLTFGSLFAGGGGMDLGFERAGIRCAWQVEINSYARGILERHFPGVPQHDDVRTFPPAGEWRVDIIAGGDPCQANSAAVGGGHSRNESLGGEFVRIVDALRPRIVVRENPTFTRKNAPWPWWRMRSAFESLGYAVLPFRLRACCFGAFHQRDRLFLLAELTDSRCERLEGWQAKTESRHPSEPTRRIHADDWMALSASRGLGSRAGFPDYVERIKLLGNAVYPDCAEWIARRIIEATKANQ
jgi:DNA (cytosine-5)-methyltransferase 1